MPHRVMSPKHATDTHATPGSYRGAMTSPDTARRHVVVVGGGMVAHRFVESLLSRSTDQWRVTLIGEENRRPYDRVGLTSFFDGATADDLTLDPDWIADERVRFVDGDPVVRVDRAARRVTTRSGLSVGYDRLVLATGS